MSRVRGAPRHTADVAGGERVLNLRPAGRDIQIWSFVQSEGHICLFLVITQQKVLFSLNVNINALTDVIMQQQLNAVSLFYIRGATLRDFIALRRNTVHAPSLVYLSLPEFVQRRSSQSDRLTAVLYCTSYRSATYNKRLWDKMFWLNLIISNKITPHRHFRFQRTLWGLKREWNKQ